MTAIMSDEPEREKDAPHVMSNSQVLEPMSTVTVVASREGHASSTKPVEGTENVAVELLALDVVVGESVEVEVADVFVASHDLRREGSSVRETVYYSVMDQVQGVSTYFLASLTALVPTAPPIAPANTMVRIKSPMRIQTTFREYFFGEPFSPAAPVAPMPPPSFVGVVGDACVLVDMAASLDPSTGSPSAAVVVVMVGLCGDM